MNSKFRRLILAAMVLATMTGGPRPVRAQSGVSYESGRIIVELREKAQAGSVDSLLGHHGVVAERALHDGLTYLVRLPNGLSVETAKSIFIGLPTVANVEPNYFCRFAETLQMSQAFLDASAPPYATGLSPEKYYDQYAIVKTSMTEAHSISTGSGLTIAQIDNGVDFSHPLLVPHLAANGYDFVDFDSDPSYQTGTYGGHGTFTAGLLVLAAPGATILPIRSLNAEGTGTAFDITMGIEYAIAEHANVLCLEFGVNFDSKVLRDVLSRANDAGIITVAPAGNDSTSALQYPAAYRTVVGVAAVDSMDIKSGFSNFGANAMVCAPGSDIYSSLPGGDLWGRWSGTSFATPLAAGLAALVRQLHPSIPAAACKRILEWGADPVDSLNPSFAGNLGWGRINFARSAGYLGRVIALWGQVHDSALTAVPNVTISVVAAGAACPRSSAVTDGAGSYASAMYEGNYELLFTPLPSSWFMPLTKPGMSLNSDTNYSVILERTPMPDSCLRPGDVNRDGIADVFDVISMIDYVFRSVPLPVPPSGCPPGNADSNCNGVVDVFDLVQLIDYVFGGGPAPAAHC